MIGRKSVVGMANVVFGALLGLVALKLIALYFDREFYGQVEYALSLLGILYVATDMSMGAAHVKRVSEGQHPGDCFATFATFRVVSTIAFVLGAVGILYVYLEVLGKVLVATTVPVFLVVVLYYVAKNAQEVAQSTFDARVESARSQIGSFVETVVRVALTVVFAFAIGAAVHRSGPLSGRIDPEAPLWRWVVAQPGAALALTFAAGAIAAAAVSLWYLMRTLERGRFRWDLLRSYWSFALPLFTVSAIGVVSSYIDRAALGFFGGSVDTADFAGLRRIVFVVDGLGTAVAAILYPVISGMAARNEREAIEQTVTRGLRYMSMLLMPMIVFIAAFPGPIIRIVLDEEWLGNTATFAILAVWIFIINLARPQANVLLGLNRSDVVARIGVATALTNVVLNVILIPEDIQSLGIRLFGLKALGAAIATLVSGIVFYAAVWFANRRLAGIRFRVPYLKHLAAALAMALALALLDRWTPFHLDRWYSLLAYTAVGAALYMAALVAIREVTRRDWQYFQETVHPIEMLRYLRSELLRR